MSISEVQAGFQIGPFTVTNTMVWTWFVMGLLTILLLWLAKGAVLQNIGNKQVVAEFIVSTINGMTSSTMGAKKLFFAPYMLSLFAFLTVSNLSGFLFFGIVRPPTADWATTLGLGLLSFVLIQGFNIKTNGIKAYLKGFVDPVPILLPLNIIGEIATPVSLSFRLFGNVCGGMIIGTLIYAILLGNTYLTAWSIIAGIVLSIIIARGKLEALKKLPAKKRKLLIFLGVICFLPVFLSGFVNFYFDLFSGILQTFIFVMLTMIFISGAMADD